MTVLKSRLVTPDGAPIVGRKVTATLMVRPSWIDDPEKGGRALGSVTGYTDANGLWKITLIGVDQYEHPDYVWYQVDEGSEQTWRVRLDSHLDEWWLKDALVDPPPPPPDYLAIDELGKLHDVDRDSVERAPDGAVLVKRGGTWVAEVLNSRLAGLDDVDAASTDAAAVGNVLEYLGDDRGWGVSASTPEQPVSLTGAFTDPGVEVSPDGMVLRLTLTQRDPSRNVLVDWGAGEAVTTLAPDQHVIDHTYEWADSYDVWAYYEGDSTGLNDMVEIPHQR